MPQITYLRTLGATGVIDYQNNGRVNSLIYTLTQPVTLNAWAVVNGQRFETSINQVGTTQVPLPNTVRITFDEFGNWMITGLESYGESVER